MAFAMGLSFPSGRFHATPWGHHVNEGIPEWPPSPWRLLRALVATWKRKLQGVEDVDQFLPGSISKLVMPPVFKLPPASLGHTRHFMPWSKGWQAEEPHKAKTMVIDTFVALGPQAEVIVAWPEVALSSEEERAVRLVLSHVSYLGRAESWCSARVVDDWESAPGHTCGWLDDGTGEMSEHTTLEGGEPIRSLVPDCAASEAHLRWDGWAYQSKKAARPEPLWNLLAETAALQAERWSDPPGSRWLTYYRMADALAVEMKPVSRPKPGPVRSVRFALDGTVLPLLTETLHVAETARRYVQGMFGKRFDGASSVVFSGRSEDGMPRQGHRHTFFLPTDEDGDGRLDHLTLFALDGFEAGRELPVLDDFRHMHGPGGSRLSLVLLCTGEPASLAPVPLFARSTKWRSVTPFVPARHFKRRGANRDTCSLSEFVEVALREEIQRRELPAPVSMRRLSRCELWDHNRRQAAAGRTMSWLKFRRERLNGGGSRSSDPGGGFEIEFPEPVSGPLALGYACHYGLGLFAPAE